MRWRSRLTYDVAMLLCLSLLASAVSASTLAFCAAGGATTPSAHHAFSRGTSTGAPPSHCEDQAETHEPASRPDSEARCPVQFCVGHLGAPSIPEGVQVQPNHAPAACPAAVPASPPDNLSTTSAPVLPGAAALPPSDLSLLYESLLI
jgi:hypothetical protein